MTAVTARNFLGCALTSTGAGNSGGDQDALEPGEHVREDGLDLGRVPGPFLAPIIDIGEGFRHR
jgi:hypothetical protein